MQAGRQEWEPRGRAVALLPCALALLCWAEHSQPLALCSACLQICHLMQQAQLAPHPAQPWAPSCETLRLQAIALMTLKQSDDPKFPLYGELPSPAMPAGGFAAASAGGLLGPQFLPHPAAPFVPAGVPTTSAMFGSSPGAAMFPLLPPGMGGGLGAVGDAGFTSLTLMLTEDQAGVLLDQGSRAVVEVEQVGWAAGLLQQRAGARVEQQRRGGLRCQWVGWGDAGAPTWKE